MVGPLLRGAFLLSLFAAGCRSVGGLDGELDGGADDQGGAPRRDLTSAEDLRAAPADLSPATKRCVQDRDCGDTASRCCGGTCRAFLDPQACGTCDQVCGAGKTCCGERETAGCVDVTSSAVHCGRCGNACGTGVRYNGQRYNFACCAGTCSDPYKDNNNCGRCGLACVGAKMCCDIGGGAACECTL